MGQDLGVSIHIIHVFFRYDISLIQCVESRTFSRSEERRESTPDG